MADFMDRIGTLSLSRRNFIKASSAAAASLSLVGCGNTLKAVDAPVNQEEKWITGGCLYDCGGKCLNKVLIKDGVVIRQKTDDTHPDSPDYNQQRACNRGRALRKHMLAPDKLKYPMKRKHWEPGGGDKSLRGKDEWVRISWDEALDILASELKKAKENYGNRSILIPYIISKEVNKVINHFGGFTNTWGTGSFGTWATTGPKVGIPFSSDGINDRMDLRNCETIIMLGLNPTWSAAGSAFYYSYLQAKNAGAKFICIDPFYNDTIASLDAEWIPIHPGTDTALLLGIAHTLIIEDNPISNPLIDWDFIKRCTVGFDAESMPKDEDSKENFKDYVLGTYDGKPKTPEWASEICGIEPNKIRYLARELRKTKKVALLTSWAPSRISHADAYPQLVMTVGSMTGHIGKPGHMTGVTAHRSSGNGGPAHYKVGASGLPTPKAPVDDCINYPVLWQSILDGYYSYVGNREKPLKAEKRNLDIRVIFHTSNNLLQTQQNFNKGIEAHRKVDFVATLAQFPTACTKYADLVLPVTTYWENLGNIGSGGTKEAVIVSTQVYEPLYEAKSDRWIAAELLKRLGYKETDLYPISEKQEFFNTIANTTVVEEDGKTFVPLVTITEADLAEWGVKGKLQQGKIGLKDFIERGVYQIERKPGDKIGYIAYENFVKDPEANPVKTASGKFEIHSRTLADKVNGVGYSKIQPIPTYISPVEGYQDTFSDWKKKVKGEYPYQILPLHHLSKAHTNFANNPWLLEAWGNPIYINTNDAKDCGVGQGDTVLVSSKSGKILRPAYLTERLMPGVVAIHHGCWADLDEATGIDKGGADNSLTGTPPTGAGTSAYNSCLVKIEKWTGKPLITDVEKPLTIIF